MVILRVSGLTRVVRPEQPYPCYIVGQSSLVMYENHLSLYPETSDIGHTLIDNKIADHSNVVGASPVGAAPTTSSNST